VNLILKTRAIHKLRPNKEWVLDEKTGLKFFDENVIAPTDTEIVAVMSEIEANDAAVESQKLIQKAAVLDRLGITEEEAQLLLS
jgi:hypothetical protein